MTLTIEQALALAVEHHQAGRFQDAERLYLQILGQQPQHADANHNLGVMALQHKQAEKALPFLGLALDSNPEQLQYWNSCLTARVQLRQTVAALDLIANARVRRLQPAAIAAMEQHLLRETQALQPTEFACAHVYRELGQFGAAAMHLTHWIDGHSGDATAHALLAHVHSLNQQPAAAQAALEAALALDASLPVVQCNLARFYLKQQKLHEALQAAQQACRASPEELENHLVLASVVLAAGNTGQATQLIGQVLQRRPLYAEALASAALVKARTNDAVAALHHARMALAIKPHLARQLLGFVASLCMQIGDLQGAGASLKQALDADPNNLDHLVNLGDCMRQQGDTGSAVEILQRALALNPNSVGAWVNLGATYQQCKQRHEAQTAYAKALEFAPEQVEVLNNLGALAKEQGQWDRAFAYFNRALEVKPDFLEVINNIASLNRHLGRLDIAVQNYQQALALKPDFSEALLGLGFVWTDLGGWGEAAVWYQKAVEAQPMEAGLHARICLAVSNYLQGDWNACRSNLDAANPINAQSHSKFKNSKSYRNYLHQLLLWHAAHPRPAPHQLPQTGKNIYAIGESHSLSAHGMTVSYQGEWFTCTSQWIEGCKQWHLGNAEENRYKKVFEATLARLPRNSVLLITIGEIDCRNDEGIMQVLQRYPDKSVDDIVQSTVGLFVQYVSREARVFGHDAIVCNVPGSNLLNLPAQDAATLATVIRKFNEHLCTQAAAAGLGYLDVYSLTNRGDGMSNGQWHIDDHHLQPSAYVEAFSRL